MGIDMHAYTNMRTYMHIVGGKTKRESHNKMIISDSVEQSLLGENAKGPGKQKSSHIKGIVHQHLIQSMKRCKLVR